MRIAVVSDLHLGFAQGTERGDDSFRNAAEAFSKALAERPDLVLVLGDIFHEKVPKPEVLGQAIEMFKSLRGGMKADAKLINYIKDGKVSVENRVVPPILSIYGTHERRNVGSVNPVHILEKAGLLFYFHASSATVQIGEERIGLHGLSGVPDKYALDSLKKWNPQPFPSMANIIMFHQTFKELIPEVQQNVLKYADLPKGFDLFLLGHIHWAVRDKHPLFETPILIPGSTVRTQLKRIEAKTKKGFYLIRVDRKVKEINFIELQGVREFFYEDMKVDGLKPSEIILQLNEKVSKIIEYHNAPVKPLIRFKLKGKLAEGFIPTDLNFASISKKFTRALIYIDRVKVESARLSERAKLLQDLKSQKISINELGMKLLLQNLKLKDPVQRRKVNQLFELLADNELEKAEAAL